MDERVAGRQYVAHPVGEAHQSQPRLIAQPLGHARAELVVAPAQAQDNGVRHLKRRPGRPQEVSHSPSAS